MAEYIKPQSPIKINKSGVDYRVYPLTTWDQVIAREELRLNAVAVTIATEDMDVTDANVTTSGQTGTTTTLNGKTESQLNVNSAKKDGDGNVITSTYVTQSAADANYLGKTAKARSASNADKLGGKTESQLSVDNADKLNNKSAEYYEPIVEILGAYSGSKPTGTIGRRYAYVDADVTKAGYKLASVTLESLSYTDVTHYSIGIVDDNTVRAYLYHASEGTGSYSFKLRVVYIKI